MLITLVFNDAVKEYDINPKAFPTIDDYIESCSTTTMIIPEYFNSSSMDWLIDTIKNNTIEDYASDEYINVNYLDMIFAEFMGINLFEITIFNGEKQITRNLENLENLEKISIPEFNTNQIIIYGNSIYVGNYKCDCHSKSEVSGIALSKIEKYPGLYKRYSHINDLFHKRSDYYYYCYSSRINIVWENVDWTIIEKFYNSKSIRPSLSLATVIINDDDDDITTTAKINIINKLKEEEYIQNADHLSF